MSTDFKLHCNMCMAALRSER